MVKELKIRYSQPNAFEVYYEGGGELPMALQGRFTDRGSAQKAIDLYLSTRAPRGKKKVDDEEV